jgi:ferredoxin
MTREEPTGHEPDRAPVARRAQFVAAPDAADAIGGRVTVTIDGHELEVPMGTSLLAATRQLGIRVPTLCHHDDLGVAGVCRVCVVEVEGQRTLQASCAFPITQRLTVRTHSPRVRRARRQILDLLLSEHHGECYACSRNGNCELQALAREYGVDGFPFGRREGPARHGGSFQPFRRAGHEQVRALPALRPHVRRPPGGGCAGGHRARESHDHLDLPRQAAGRRRLHQLRAVQQPVPHAALRAMIPPTRSGRRSMIRPSTS